MYACSGCNRTIGQREHGAETSFIVAQHLGRISPEGAYCAAVIGGKDQQGDFRRAGGVPTHSQSVAQSVCAGKDGGDPEGASPRRQPRRKEFRGAGGIAYEDHRGDDPDHAFGCDALVVSQHGEGDGDHPQFCEPGVWIANGLKPHLIRTFKLSSDPQFENKLVDVVGLYMDPPDNAVVFSFDEKSSIQALDRTQPGLPLKKGRCGTVTHDYKRHGTTSLFAALNMASGEVIGQTYRRHRHQEVLRFFKAVEKTVDRELEIHIILDNYSTHRHKNVLEWIDSKKADLSSLHTDQLLVAESG